jgi:hypothetical protein
MQKTEEASWGAGGGGQGAGRGRGHVTGGAGRGRVGGRAIRGQWHDRKLAVGGGCSRGRGHVARGAGRGRGAAAEQLAGAGAWMAEQLTGEDGGRVQRIEHWRRVGRGRTTVLRREATGETRR